MDTPWSYVMKVSKNGQISIPAAVRARWQTDEVVVVDRGSYVVVAPKLPLSELRGKYSHLRGPTVDEMRLEEREAEAERELRRYGR